MAKLLKRKHPNQDLFICDIFDAMPKDLQHQLEHPMFTLSKKPDMNIRMYTSPNQHDYIQFQPSAYGLANIYDKDILIFVISQMMHKINNGEEPSQTVRFSAYDLLVATNKKTGGHDYKILERSFERLAGTRIKTCLLTGGKQIIEGFGIIDKWKIIKEGWDGRMEGLEVKLSDWMYNGVLSNEVLSLSRDYFLISSPLERRIYEICRKHCGRKQGRWHISIKKLHLKSGSQSSVRRFKQAIKKIISDQNVPEYTLYLEGDLFIVKPKKKALKLIDGLIPIKPKTIENAKKILSGQFDVYGLQAEYSGWIKNKEQPKKGYDAAFIGFCKRKVNWRKKQIEMEL